MLRPLRQTLDGERERSSGLNTLGSSAAVHPHLFSHHQSHCLPHSHRGCQKHCVVTLHLNRWWWGLCQRKAKKNMTSDLNISQLLRIFCKLRKHSKSSTVWVHVRLWHTPSNKVLHAQTQGHKPQAAMDLGGGHCNDYEKPPRAPRRTECRTRVHRCERCWYVGAGEGEEGQWLQEYRGKQGGVESSPERFLRTRQGPLRPWFTLPPWQQSNKRRHWALYIFFL